MDDKRSMLRHFLAALAVPDSEGPSRRSCGFRHVRSDCGRPLADGAGPPHDERPRYARTMFVGGEYRPDSLTSLQAEVDRLHTMLEDLGRHIDSGAPLLNGLSPEQLLQGPFADAMTHVGQLALLRRLRGSPVPPENFVFANIDSRRLGADQASPARPDEVWPEAPPGWNPSTRK